MLLSRVQQPRLALAFAVAGALSFWLPDVAIHIIAGRTFDAPHARLITLIMPTAFLTAYLAARTLAAKRGYKRLGVAMLVGVWLGGGVFMTISATAAGGGFAGPNGVRGTVIVVLMSMVPIYTYIMAAYDGSLLALLAVTVGALLICCVQASGLPLPSLRRHR